MRRADPQSHLGLIDCHGWEKPRLWAFQRSPDADEIRQTDGRLGLFSSKNGRNSVSLPDSSSPVQADSGFDLTETRLPFNFPCPNFELPRYFWVEESQGRVRGHLFREIAKWQFPREDTPTLVPASVEHTITRNQSSCKYAAAAAPSSQPTAFAQSVVTTWVVLLSTWVKFKRNRPR